IFGIDAAAWQRRPELLDPILANFRPRRRSCTPPPKTIASPLNGGISIPRTPRRVLKLLQRGHAPGAETSSGLALLRSHARRRGGGVVCSYCVTGRPGDLGIPPITSATRADELWRTTCFEAFVRTSASSGYYEFNFAPSTQWAAYEFSRYRSGMRAATDIAAP